jgi:membrane protease YdiL (CAAX protease family)
MDFRDVRIYNGQRGYAYKMPMDSLRDLTSAPFRFSVLKKPEVWGGFIGAFALAITTAKFMFPQEAKFSTSLAPKYAISPFVALPIGIGEESLFRGLLQSSLSETFGQVGGIAISSLAFGAVHAPNAYAMPPEHRWRYYAFSMPLITTLGAYFGWVTQRNHSLQESVAIHTWYDFIIFAASAAATRASIMNRADFNFSADF